MAWSNVSDVGASENAPRTKSSMRCVVSFLLIEDMVASSKDAEKFAVKSQHRAVDRDTEGRWHVKKRQNVGNHIIVIRRGGKELRS